MNNNTDEPRLGQADVNHAASKLNTPALEAFSICGSKPFWSPSDCANIHREQAFALLTLIADAFHASEDANEADASMHAPITSVRPRIIGEALQGIAALVALSQHATDCADSPSNGSAGQ